MAKTVFNDELIIPEVGTNWSHLQFAGRGQRDTPMTDAKGIVEVSRRKVAVACHRRAFLPPRPRNLKSPKISVTSGNLGKEIARIRKTDEIPTSLHR